MSLKVTNSDFFRKKIYPIFALPNLCVIGITQAYKHELQSLSQQIFFIYYLTDCVHGKKYRT